MKKKFLKVVLCVLPTFLITINVHATPPIYGYFDLNMYRSSLDGTGFTLDYVNTMTAKSLYQIQKHAYEGSGSYIYLDYAPPTPYVVESRFTNALDAIGQFAGPNDVAFVHLTDEPSAYMSKTEIETMIAHAKSRLPGYKIAISDSPNYIPSQVSGLPNNADIVMLNWYPFAGWNTGNIPTTQAQFDTQTQAMLNKLNKAAGTKLILVAQGFKNIAESVGPPPIQSINWYANWVGTNDIIGVIIYKWNGSGSEYGTKDLETIYGPGYISAQRQLGNNWGILTSLAPPVPTPPALPSTFDRQILRTFAGEDGWDGHAGSTSWFGAFGDQAHSGIQSLRVRTTNNYSSWISRRIPAEAYVKGQLEMFVKVTNFTGNDDIQILGIFTGYGSDDVSGNGQFLLMANPSVSLNYIVQNEVGDQTITGFPVTGGWDRIVVQWDTSLGGVGNNIFKVWVNGAGPIENNGYYDEPDVEGIRIFAPQDNDLVSEPAWSDPPAGFEMWVDDIDVTAYNPPHSRELMYGVNVNRYGRADLEGYGANTISSAINWPKWVVPMAAPDVINGKTYEAIALDSAGYMYKVDFETGTALGYWASNNWDSIYPLQGDPGYNYVALSAGRVAKVNIPVGYATGYDATWQISVTWTGVQSICPLYGVAGYNAAFVSGGYIAKLDTNTMTGAGVGGGGANWTQISPLRGDSGWQLVGINTGRIGKIDAVGYGGNSISGVWSGLIWAASASGDPSGRNAFFLDGSGNVAEVDTRTWTGAGVGGAGSSWAMMLEDAVPVGDLDAGSTVEFVDLGILADWWLSDCGEPDWCDGADIYKSGKVNFVDFANMAANWMTQIW